MDGPPDDEDKSTSGKRKSIAIAPIATATKQKKKAGQNEVWKDEQRRAANRRSAFNSRQRSKVILEDLQKSVEKLTEEGDELRNINIELRSKLEVARHENKLLKEFNRSSSTGCPIVPAFFQTTAQSGFPYATIPTSSLHSATIDARLLSIPTEIPSEAVSVTIGALTQLTGQRNSEETATSQTALDIGDPNMQLLQQLTAPLARSSNNSSINRTSAPVNNHLELQLRTIQAILANIAGATDNETSDFSAPSLSSGKPKSSN